MSSKKFMASAAFATSMLVSGGASASLYFTVTTDFGTSNPFNILSSNVDATSTYSSASNPGATSFDELIGAVDVLVNDTSTGGEVNSLLDGTSNIGSGGSGSIGDDYRLFFEYTLSGTAQIVDGLGIPGIADGTMDSNSDGIIDSNAIICGIVVCGGLDSIVPNYTSGTITLSYQRLQPLPVGTPTKILELDFVSAQADGTNVILFANVDYSWYIDGSDDFVENFSSCKFSSDKLGWSLPLVGSDRANTTSCGCLTKVSLENLQEGIFSTLLIRSVARRRGMRSGSWALLSIRYKL